MAWVAIDLHAILTALEMLVQREHVHQVVGQLRENVNMTRIANAALLCTSAIETMQYQIRELPALPVGNHMETWCLHIVCSTDLCSLMRTIHRSGAQRLQPVYFHDNVDKLNGINQRRLFNPVTGGYSSHLIYFGEPSDVQGSSLPRAQRIVMCGPLEGGVPKVRQRKQLQ